MDNNSTYEEDIQLALEMMREFSLKEKKKSQVNIKKFKTINKDDFTFANCKTCNKLFKISCKYDGPYPLCYLHRDPNNRLIIKNT